MKYDPFLTNLIIELILSIGVVVTSVVYTLLWVLMPRNPKCKMTSCWVQRCWLLIMIGNGIFGIVFMASTIALMTSESFYGLAGMFFMRIFMLVVILSTALMVVSSLIKDFADVKSMQSMIHQLERELSTQSEEFTNETENC